MRRLVLALVGWGLLAGGWPSAQADEPAAPPARGIKILLVGHDKDGHPHATHEYLPVCRLLAACLRQTEGVEPVISNGWPDDPALADGARAIVLYVPWGSNVLFDGPQRQQARQLLDAGAGLVAVHWSTGAEREEFGQLWLDYLGAWFHTDFSFLEHVERRQRQADPAHPICRGWSDYDLFDEYYFDLRFAPGSRPLITVDHKDRTQTIAWIYQRSGARGGRSFGYVAGHYHKNFGNQAFRRTVVNAILWTAGLDVPPQGAGCAVEPADLELPEPAK